MNKHFQKSSFTNQTTVEFWNNIYNSQDFYGDRFRKRMSKALTWLDGMGLSKDSRFLEVGSGAGRLTGEATQRGYNILGLDYSYEMLVKANSTFNCEERCNIPFLQGDIESLPFRDSSFDAVICLGVITYIESYEKAFHELARILKPRGMLVLSFVNKVRLVRVMDLPLLSKSIFHKMLNSKIVFRKKTAKTNNNADSKTYLIPIIRRSLEMAGFTIREYETITLDLFTFFGREVLPRKMSVGLSMFIDQFSNIPIIGSFGGMCMFKAEKTK